MAAVNLWGSEEQIKNFLSNFSEINHKIFKNFLEAKNKLRKTQISFLCNFLKSERYEIFCAARTLKIPYIVIYFTEEDNLEAPNHKYRYDQPLIKFVGEEDLKIIFNILQGGTEKISRATKRKIVDGNYFSTVNSILKKIKSEFFTDKNIGKILIAEAEKKFFMKLEVQQIPLEEIEKSFKTILNDEIEKRKI